MDKISIEQQKQNARTAVEKIEEWYNIARQRSSLPAETDEKWMEWVCKPVIQYPLAPRQARAILEFAGVLAAQGVPVRQLLIRLISLFVDGRLCSVDDVDDPFVTSLLDWLKREY